MPDFKFILLVDDDHIANYLHKNFLTKITSFSNIETASNGEQALSIIHDHAENKSGVPDLIFLDINMPVCDGFEFVEAFNNMNIPEKSKVDIVVVTSSSNSNDIKRMEDLGVKYYLNKPLNTHSLSDFFNNRKARVL